MKMKSFCWSLLASFIAVNGSFAFQLDVVSVANPDESLTIKGSDLSKVKNVPTIMYDGADFAVQNGVYYDRKSYIYDGFKVVRKDSYLASDWVKPSTEGVFGAVSVQVKKNSFSEWYNNKYLYYVDGEKGYLGWPNAYGGLENTSDNKRLYVSWWMWQKYDTRFYFVFNLDSVSSNFKDIPDSELMLEDGTKGKLIRYVDGEVHLQFEGISHTSDLANQKVTQVETGGTAILSANGAKSSGNNKYIRIWEHPDGNQGIRISWTNANLGGGGANDWLYSLSKPAPIAGQWNHMEIFVDGSTNTATTYVNGVMQAHIDWNSIESDYRDIEGMYSPTIALIGFDGKIPVYQQTYFDNIYMSNEFGRVVISEDKVLESGSKYFVQPITKVTEESVEFKFHPGTYAPGILYVHYLTGLDVKGSVGVPLCFKCEISPPAPPADLSIQ